MAAEPNDGVTPAAAGVTIKFTCPCGKTVTVKAEHAGKKVKCGACQRIQEVPTANTMAISLVDSLASKDPQQQTLDEVPRPESDFWTFLAPAQSDDEIGRLGPYRVLRVLGVGGMGVVFKAEDPALKRIVALKAMLPSGVQSPSAKDRFLREARTAAALKHDHIVCIHQVGEDRGVPYLAMEFLEGESLDDRLLRERRLPVSDALRIGIEVADGLAAAHDQGLIHRDIKPGNLWLETRASRRKESATASAARSGPRAKILDFGLARPDDDTRLTRTGAIIGTPAYMPIEQARGHKVDGRADLYSLGVVLYKMLTGEFPYKGVDTVSILTALALDTPVEPSAVNEDIPPRLNDLIMKLLSKDPSDRPATAHDLVASLEAIATEVNGQFPDPGPGTMGDAAAKSHCKPQLGGRRRWPLIIASGLGTTAIVLLLIGAAIYWSTPAEKKESRIAKVDPVQSPRPNVNPQFAKLEPKAIEPPPAKSTPTPATVKAGEEMTNSIGMTLVSIPPGRFLMGSRIDVKGRGDDEFQHEVEITKGFWLGKYEVTQEQYEKVMGDNPSQFKGSKLPVESVTWIEAKEFCRKLSAKEGKEYSLPTEAEWEYACRAGTNGPFSTGEILTTNQANYNGKGSYGGNATNIRRGKTTEVGQFPANGFGLCDMHGNVWEFCEDWYGPYEVKGLIVDPKGPSDGSSRVSRGGSWSAHDAFCRSANRNSAGPTSRAGVVGFRVALRSVK